MDSSKETRWQQRYENLQRASDLLTEASAMKTMSDLEAEGMVQRFEYTFELAWKTLKDYLEAEGLVYSYPREIIKAAFETGLLQDGETWMEMLERRNEAAHTYDRRRFDRSLHRRWLPSCTLWTGIAPDHERTAMLLMTMWW